MTGGCSMRVCIFTVFFAAVVQAIMPNNVHAVRVGGFGNMGSNYNMEQSDGSIALGGGGMLIDTDLTPNDRVIYRFNLGIENISDFYYKKSDVKVQTRSRQNSQNVFTVPTFYTVTNKSIVNIYTLGITIVQTVGFGLLRAKYATLWLGPEIILGYLNGGVKQLMGCQGGMGLAMGLNLNLSSVYTIAFTGSARGSMVYRYMKYSTVAYYDGIIDDNITPIMTTKSENETRLRYMGQVSVAVIYRMENREY
jgi:hypothetical protein